MVPPLESGAFPLGLAGAPGGVAKGRRDDPTAIARALDELRGDGPPLLPRMYVNWRGRRTQPAGSGSTGASRAPPRRWSAVC
jgi:hypothetical protein